jgi:hypothetical protein
MWIAFADRLCCAPCAVLCAVRALRRRRIARREATRKRTVITDNLFVGRLALSG